MFLLPLFYLFACSPCKELCSDMAKFAEDECGYTVTNEMMSECRTQQGEKTREEKQDCRQAAPALEAEWNCDELSIYFENSASTINTSESNDTGN